MHGHCNAHIVYQSHCPGCVEADRRHYDQNQRRLQREEENQRQRGRDRKAHDMMYGAAMAAPQVVTEVVTQNVYVCGVCRQHLTACTCQSTAASLTATVADLTERLGREQETTRVQRSTIDRYSLKVGKLEREAEVKDARITRLEKENRELQEECASLEDGDPFEFITAQAFCAENPIIYNYLCHIGVFEDIPDDPENNSPLLAVVSALLTARGGDNGLLAAIRNYYAMTSTR